MDMLAHFLTREKYPFSHPNLSENEKLAAVVIEQTPLGKPP